MNTKPKVLIIIVVFTLMAITLVACATADPIVDTAAQEAAEAVAAAAQAEAG